MKRNTLFLILTCAALNVAPAYGAALEVKAVVPHSVNELPFYGNIEKTDAMKQADEEFKKTAIEKTGTPDKAAAYFAESAWTAFKDGELNHAMRLANQAWLLDNKNDRAYWVMALIQHFRGAPKEEINALFQKALVYAEGADRPTLMKDYETFQRSGDAVEMDNAEAIAEGYRKAKATLIGQKP